MRQSRKSFSFTVTFPNPAEMEAARKTLANFDCFISETDVTLSENTAVVRSGYPSELKAHITNREKEVLLLLAKGFSYSESSEFLDCSISTIQTHVKRIYNKLGVNSKSEAVYEALQNNIIDL